MNQIRKYLTMLPYILTHILQSKDVCSGERERERERLENLSPIATWNYLLWDTLPCAFYTLQCIDLEMCAVRREGEACVESMQQLWLTEENSSRNMGGSWDQTRWGTLSLLDQILWFIYCSHLIVFICYQSLARASPYCWLIFLRCHIDKTSGFKATKFWSFWISSYILSHNGDLGTPKCAT